MKGRGIETCIPGSCSSVPKSLLAQGESDVSRAGAVYRPIKALPFVLDGPLYCFVCRPVNRLIDRPMGCEGYVTSQHSKRTTRCRLAKWGLGGSKIRDEDLHKQVQRL